MNFKISGLSKHIFCRHDFKLKEINQISHVEFLDAVEHGEEKVYVCAKCRKVKKEISRTHTEYLRK